VDSLGCDSLGSWQYWLLKRIELGLLVDSIKSLNKSRCG
jgi:hypothetical protein